MTIACVRVTYQRLDTGTRYVDVHNHGRDARREDDGALTVFDEQQRACAIYQPNAWSSVELVYAPEVVAATISNLTVEPCADGVWPYGEVAA